MTAQRVVLWRHGRTTYNQEKRFQGQRDVPMDAVGVAQVDAAAGLLAARLEGGEVRIVSSDLSRAMDSARVLAGLLGVAVVEDMGLREASAGEWEGLTRDEITAGWAGDFAAWTRGEDVRIGGGESRSEVAHRAERSIREHAASMPAGVLVVASHSGPLRGAALKMLGLNVLTRDVLGPLFNAHWAELVPRGNGYRLVCYNVGPGRSAGTADDTEFTASAVEVAQ